MSYPFAIFYFLSLVITFSTASAQTAKGDPSEMTEEIDQSEDRLVDKFVHFAEKVPQGVESGIKDEFEEPPTTESAPSEGEESADGVVLKGGAPVVQDRDAGKDDSYTSIEADIDQLESEK